MSPMNKLEIKILTISNTEIPIIRRVGKKNYDYGEGEKTLTKQIGYNSDPKDHFDPSEFKTIKRIGEGSYGKIYIVQWVRNNKKYAMKKELIKTNDIVNKSKEKIKLMNDFITKK